jgi:ketosteroid isomerase-like protein
MSSDLVRLESRLRRLEDIEEIRQLRMRYHYCVNETMYAQAAELYTEDAHVSFDALASATGRRAIAELFDRLEKNVALITQFIANHMVTVNEDEATGISYADARYAQKGESIIAAVRYEDKYRRTPEGWKFTEMLVKVFFSVPLTQGWGGGKLNRIEFVERER